MTELVRRGVTAVPAILRHLSDPRPTKLSITGGFIMAAWFSDEYEYRFQEVAHQPSGVNTVGISFENRKDCGQYTLRVGDLCFVALGQIVNRGYSAMRYQPTACLVVNSPVEFPALAKAAKADWDSLDAKSHCQSLRADVLAGESFGRSDGGLPRLLFYYPESGRQTAAELLGRPLLDQNAIYGFIFDDLAPASAENRARLITAFEQSRAAKYRTALRASLQGMANDASAGREEERALSIGLLSLLLPNPNADSNPVPAYVSFYDQNELLESLHDFDWEGLDGTVLDLFRSSIREAATTVGGRIERDDLAYTCAMRLLHRGHDPEFKAFFTAELPELKREDQAAIQNQASLPQGNAGYHPALSHRIERMEKLVAELQ